MASVAMNFRKPFIIKANKVEKFENTSNKKDIETIFAIASKFEQNNEKLKKER